VLPHVTESVLVDEGPAATHLLSELRAMGIRLAIDDFGTGYSSLLYLRRLRVDALKIDRSFVDGLGHDNEDDTIVRTIINLAESLGLGLVAEGVETEQQRQLGLLNDYGCPYAQGYLFSKPLAPETFADRYPSGRTLLGPSAPLVSPGGVVWLGPMAPLCSAPPPS
jgi:EAL domain-containing protein (putative c-di-GMP-specific phosphodiesterase class I)